MVGDSENGMMSKGIVETHIGEPHPNAGTEQGGLDSSSGTKSQHRKELVLKTGVELKRIMDVLQEIDGDFKI
jgi:hypothetical protein